MAPLDDIPSTSQAGVSIHEAAVLLGVSPNTVRRWCAMGRLRSERVKRPQGESIRVYLDDAVRQVPTEVPPVEVPRDVPPGASEQVPTGPDRSEALLAWTSSLLVPIAAELGEARQMLERQAGQLVEKEREIGAIREERGRLTAELERAASTVAALSDQLTAAESIRRRTTRWAWIGLAVATVLVIAAVAAPAWVR